MAEKLEKDDDGFWHWCPACKMRHFIAVGAETGPNWTFNGDMQNPTFSPGVRFRWVFGPGRVPECCHYFIEAGVIKFCGDCTHDRAGKQTPLPDLPYKED